MTLFRPVSVFSGLFSHLVIRSAIGECIFSHFMAGIRLRLRSSSIYAQSINRPTFKLEEVNSKVAQSTLTHGRKDGMTPK